MQVRSRRGFLAAAAAITVASAVGACGEPGADTGPLGVSSGGGRLPSAAESLSSDGTTIVLGDPNAALRVRLYEDPSCPACAEFETEGTGPYLKRAVRNGGLQLQFTLGSFLGPGSKLAVNALRAALDQGRFDEYHHRLYRYHDKVRGPRGITQEGLLTLAGMVDGLRGPAFDAAVRDTAHRGFVESSATALDGSPVRGTPAMEINGVLVPTGSDLYTDRDRLARRLKREAGAAA
ncbi:DsbA family protein [Streptomyces sp. H27-S2]|uniref:DsbA family protein n=1 Tax=Streptomyces antarcticus TaxID=2996458 RepID=UPI00226EFF27|nr:thioredoxin domain-containing protein [Streptomyces sp. H27-S2]MCY0953296.1 thioredoxin domain-containing protein [Streptomyces sp. H27-S2]